MNCTVVNNQGLLVPLDVPDTYRDDHDYVGTYRRCFNSGKVPEYRFFMTLRNEDLLLVLEYDPTGKYVGVYTAILMG